MDRNGQKWASGKVDRIDSKMMTGFITTVNGEEIIFHINDFDGMVSQTASSVKQDVLSDSAEKIVHFQKEYTDFGCRARHVTIIE